MKKIRVGLAAFGTSGAVFHAPFLNQHPDFELSAIVERNKNESRALYPETKLYRSFDDMLCDSTLDLVVVNTPVQTHFQYAQKALNKGINTIVEKPFTVDANEAEILNQLAQEKGVFLSVFHNRRWDGDFIKVREIIGSGVLGAIKEVDVMFYRYRSEISAKKHKEAPILGAGILHDLGSHIIDQSLQLFGYPRALFADLGHFRPETKTNDYFEIILFYDNELRVRLRASMLALENAVGYIVQGEKGAFKQNRIDAQEMQLREGKLPKISPWAKPLTQANAWLTTTETQQKIVTQSGNYMNYYEAVCQCLINKKNNPVPPVQALDVMRIIDAALCSATQQRKVVL